MPKRKLDRSEEKMQRFIKEGRGQGTGENYKLWITVQNFPSSGRSSPTAGWKSNRVHHFFSDLEIHYFLEWSDFVLDTSAR